MKKFDKTKAYDDFHAILSKNSSTGTFSEQMKIIEEVKSFLESVYINGFEAGVKSKVNTLKKLN